MILLAAYFFMIAGLQPLPDPPDSITLAYCYRQAAENYPIAQNITLQHKITDLNVAIAQSGYYPQINTGGKASYQSEITQFSLPGAQEPPAPPKDQYEVSVDVTQKIYSAGAVGIRKKLERVKGRREIAASRVQLHQLRNQIDQIYFGILLSKRQADIIQLLIKNLEEQLSTVRSRVENGVMLASQQYIVEAELIKARQDSADIQSNIGTGYAVLSEIIGENISLQTDLKLPDVQVNYRSFQPQRPEYEAFEEARAVIEQRKALAEALKWPQVSAFGTAAYGRPGLNFLSEDFHDYYIAGVRVKWNLWDYVNGARQAEVLSIEQQKITQNRLAFDRQLQASLERIRGRIEALREKIKRDREIVKLRSKIVKETASQLKYGVITATEYVTELTEATQAELSLYINKIRLVQAQTDYLTTLGVSLH